MEEEKEIKEEKVEESVEIETKIVVGESKIKEMVFSVNTAASGAVKFLSDEVNGYLEGFIINAEQPVEILITEEPSNIDLLNIGRFISNREFIAVREGTVSTNGESFRDSYAKIPLNGVLGVIVKGPKHTLVNFIVRYC